MNDQDITKLRLQIFNNEFVPLASIDKLCVLPNWPRICVTETLITERWARMNRYTATAIRLENGLAVIDLDIDDEPAVSEIIEQLKMLLPGCHLLCRHGKGMKLALFVRTAEPFGRLHSCRWTKPGETEENGAHVCEIFGGKSARYFGSFNWHSLGQIKYRWAGNSPADTHFSMLPVFTKKQLFMAADATDQILEQRGWTFIALTKAGENATLRVRDLTQPMTFYCNDDRIRTLAELGELARHDALPRGLRCSASWLEGPSARRSDRCLIGHTNRGELTVFETSSGVTHIAKLNEDDHEKVKETLRRIEERGGSGCLNRLGGLISG